MGETELNDYTTKVVLIEPLPSNKLKEKLKGKLILNNDTIPFEIFPDEKIYRELKEIFYSIEYCNYRLSLNYKWNPFEKKYVSTVTKINGEYTEHLYIHCSKDYQNLLDFFRKIDNIDQLKDASDQYGINFILDEFLQTENDEKEHEEGEKENSVKAQSKSNKLKNIILIGSGTLLIGIFILIIFSYVHANNKAIHDRAEVLEREISKIKNVVHENRVVYSETIQPSAVEEPFTYYQIEDQIIYGLPEGKVALTFDDGPSQFTEDIVNILLDHNIGATFFFVGSRTEMFPNSANYVRDHQMIVANHSWSHANFLHLSEEERLNELILTNEALNLVESASVLFRPPYGLYNENILNQFDEKFKFVLWNRDPRDWIARSKEEIINNIQTTDPSGAIYILHENQSTVSALPQIIQWIKQHDVEFVVLK